MPGARDAAGARAFSNHAIYRVRCDDPPAMTLGLHVHVTYPGAVCVCAWPTRAGGARRVSRDPMRARLLSHVRQSPTTSRCNSPRESDAADRIPYGARWWHTPSLFCIVQGTHGEQPELVQPELSRSRRADTRDRERKTRSLALRGSPIDMPIDRTRTEMGPSHGPSARSMIACTPDQLLPCLMSSDVDRIRGLFLHVSARIYPSFVNRGGFARHATLAASPAGARFAASACASRGCTFSF
jgi:hypothetical protein